ncbi:formylglycine-generating enzyme family protein [soil metagenome]
MGAADPDGFAADGEGPVRNVEMPEFWIDATTVTNRRFAAFVGATGYLSDAEREGWSYVFYAAVDPKVPQRAIKGSPGGAPWWLAVEGASWHSPDGPGSDVAEKLGHPVVHVSWNDAAAYAAYAGKRLPSEAEWEKAARGGLDQKRFPWGDELTPGGEHRCNIWQGEFPHVNSAEDGHLATARVTAFAPNGYGLHNCAGNVWEWCADWWSAEWHVPAGDLTRRNPAGPQMGVAKVIRGGSYLCNASYCNRYRTAARTFNMPNSTTGHTGFRCAATASGGVKEGEGAERSAH